MLVISGVGQVKLERYGEAFIDEIESFLTLSSEKDVLDG